MAKISVTHATPKHSARKYRIRFVSTFLSVTPTSSRFLGIPRSCCGCSDAGSDAAAGRCPWLCLNFLVMSNASASDSDARSSEGSLSADFSSGGSHSCRLSSISSAVPAFNSALVSVSEFFSNSVIRLYFSLFQYSMTDLKCNAHFQYFFISSSVSASLF